MESRQDVYKAIDDERDYQDEKWGEDEVCSIGDYLIFMDHYVTQAKEALTCHAGPKISALHEIRKIAALGVLCMEKHGAIER